MSKRNPMPDFVVRVDLFNGLEVGIFRDIEEMRAWCKATRLDTGKGFNAANTNACAGYDHDPEGIPWFFAYIPRKCRPYKVCHECLHLAWFILKDHGVKVKFGTHEVLAYLMDHLAQQILQHK